MIRLRNVWASITRCPCIHFPYLNHVSKQEHIRNGYVGSGQRTEEYQ